MKFLLLFAFSIGICFSINLKEDFWKSGETFLTFLERYKLPLSIYYDLDGEDKKLAEGIGAGVRYSILTNNKAHISQVLIPIGEELQLHIYKKNGKYKLKISSIIFETKTLYLNLKIKNSPYYDIVKLTGNLDLAQEFVNSYKTSINFSRDLRKDDSLVIIYEQKFRIGKRFGAPTIISSFIEVNKKRKYVFRNLDGRYYNKKGIKIEGFLLAKPLRYSRVSSRFTYKRYHPVLKRYRAHLGIDYIARRGTPIKAAASGLIVSRYYSATFGNVIKIRHSGGYSTLYAHLKSFKRGLKRGYRVKKGSVIGYLGNTGLSTGPHLHFALYKYNRAINPLSAIQVNSTKLKGSKKRKFDVLKRKYMQNLDFYFNKENLDFEKLNSISYYTEVNKSI